MFLFFKGNDDFHLDVYKNGYPSGLKGPRDGREWFVFCKLYFHCFKREILEPKDRQLVQCEGPWMWHVTRSCLQTSGYQEYTEGLQEGSNEPGSKHTLFYSKNVLLWLTIEQRLDVWHNKKALMTPGPSRWSRTGTVPCGRPPWVQSLARKPTSPPQRERSCMVLCFCFFLWCSSYSCNFTRWSGQEPFICSFLITQMEYA